jgi:hypothetical protein
LHNLLDWNPVFEQVIAQPLGLVRGRHVVPAMENSREIVERSVKVFKPPIPLFDSEILEFRSPVYGLIRFRKIACQVPDEGSRRIAWSVNLNILSAEKEAELWADIGKRLDRELNWSKYAVKYDKLLLNFDAYRELLETVTAMVGGAKVITDLASGTGNGAIKLLADVPGRPAVADRTVWAFEANQMMLEHMRCKTQEEAFARAAKDPQGRPDGRFARVRRRLFRRGRHDQRSVRDGRARAAAAGDLSRAQARRRARAVDVAPRD